MEYQSLKKLKRMDLLEMLIAQVEENERLLEKMEQLHFQLERQKTLSPREAGASGSAASTQVSSRAMGRSQGFAGSAGYAGSAGLMGSAGSAAAMASRSSAVSSTSTCLTGSAGSLRSTSGMKAHHGIAAGNQGTLSSVAQSDPYAPASQADPYAPAAENASAVKGPQTSQPAPYRSAAQTAPYAPASQVNSYAQTPSYASAAQSDPYAPASQSASYKSAAQAEPYAQTSQAAPYAAVSQTDPYASESPCYVAAQSAPYAAERESGRMGQPDRPREELYHPDLLREENYARQPLTFGEKEGAGMLPSFLQEMPREDREDYSRSRVQLSREAQAARPDEPLHQQNVVPLKPSQVGTRTENFAPASSAASVVAGAGTPAARQVLSGEYVSSGASAETLAATPFNAYVGERQGRVRPLPFAAEPGNAVTDKVNRSHA